MRFSKVVADPERVAAVLLEAIEKQFDTTTDEDKMDYVDVLLDNSIVTRPFHELNAPATSKKQLQECHCSMRPCMPR